MKGDPLEIVTTPEGRLLESADALRSALRERKFFVFDLDGTIADTSALHARAFNQVLAPFGRTFRYLDYSGMGTLDVIHSFLSKAGLQRDDGLVANLARAKQKLARDLIESELAPLPGVDEFLSWCKESGRRMGMVTSGSADTVAITLRRLGYADSFAPLVTGNDVGRSKPHPQGYRLALQHSGFIARESVAFEDASAGIIAATGAGLDCIDVRVHSWGTLLERAA